MYAQRGCVDKGSELEALRSLTPMIMTTLLYAEIYDAVTELFTDILNHFPTFLTTNDFRALSIFLTTEDAQIIVARLRTGEFDTDDMSFARLLLAYGDAAVQDLATKTHDPRMGQLLFQLLDLLKCDGYDDVEVDVYSGAFEFWTTYIEFAIDSRFDEGQEKGDAIWMDVARQRIEAVIEVIWERIQAPPPEIAISWVSRNAELFPMESHDIVWEYTFCCQPCPTHHLG
jgi:hypothetical protein